MAMASFIANRKGGVGKTQCAIAVAEACRSIYGQYPRLVDCDKSHKLAQMMSDVQLIEPADADLLKKDSSLIVGQWDEIGDSLCGGVDVVFDLGSNLDDAIIDWARKSNISKYVGTTRINFFVPTTTDILSVNGALGLLEKIPEAFPTARRILVLNEHEGPFSILKSHPDFIALISLAGVDKVILPECDSPLWPTLQRDGITYAGAVDLGAVAIAKALGLQRIFAVERDLGIIAEWGKATQTALVPFLTE